MNGAVNSMRLLDPAGVLVGNVESHPRITVVRNALWSGWLPIIFWRS